MEVDLPGSLEGSAPLRKAALGEDSWNNSWNNAATLFDVLSRMLNEEQQELDHLLASRHAALLRKLEISLAHHDAGQEGMAHRNIPRVSEPYTSESSAQKQKVKPDRQIPELKNRQSTWGGTKSTELSDALVTNNTSSKKSFKVNIAEMPLYQRAVLSNHFDSFFTCLILLNSAVMASELQYQGMEIGNDYFEATGYWDLPWAERFFEFADWFFGILFTLELVASISVKKINFFWKPPREDEDAKAERKLAVQVTISWLARCMKFPGQFWDCLFGRLDWWGVLDFAVVFFWIIQKAGSSILMFDPMMLRLARLAKLLRMLKLVKTIKGFDSLYLLTTTLEGCVSALFWSVVLLFVCQAVLAFILCQQMQTYYENTSEPWEDRRQIWLYFGTYSRAVFTLFEITLANWTPVARALMDRVSEWFVLFSLLHKFMVGFATVNVINGVFMQKTFKVAAADDTIMLKQNTKAALLHREKMTKLFNRGDTDGSGCLKRDEFVEMMGDPTLKTWMASMELNIAKAEDIDAVFSLIAGDDDEITLEELVTETSRLKGGARTIDVELRFQELLHVIASMRNEFQETYKMQAQTAKAHTHKLKPLA